MRDFCLMYTRRDGRGGVDMNKVNKVKIGDWVRFYQQGKLVIGSVEYIDIDCVGKVTICTDVGGTSPESVLERRVAVGVDNGKK